MIHKKITGLSRSAFYLLGTLILGVCVVLLATRELSVKTEDETPVATNNRIHGQVIYDQNATLPPQAMLVVQLTGRDRASGSQKIITESRHPISEQMPVDFILPVTTTELDKNYSYALHAKISIGDALWFVNETSTPVEPERAGYLIRLTMIEHNNNDIANKELIKGREWFVEDIFGQGIIDDSHITLHIDDNARDDPSGDGTRYSTGGSGGCNRYSTVATLDEDKNTLAFEPPVMTFMACAEAISYQETEFIGMLSKVRAYRINPLGLLYLLDESGNTIARFSPAD